MFLMLLPLEFIYLFSEVHKYNTRSSSTGTYFGSIFP